MIQRARERVLAQWPRLRGPTRLGLSVAGVIVLGYVFSVGRAGFDFYAYWVVDPRDPYRIVDGLGAFHYAPPLAILAGPLKLLPFEAAFATWTALNAGVLVWLARSWALAWCAFPPVAAELFHGNVHLLLAATMIIGFRHGGAWAAHALSKVTTTVGLGWAIVREDWRMAGMAVATAAAVAGASIALQGADVWADWVAHLLDRAARPEVGGALLDPSLALRLPIAVAAIVGGALTGRRWVVPIAVTLAMPLLWYHALATLAALAHPEARRREAATGA